MRYEHGRARALTHPHFSTYQVGLQATLSPLGGRHTRTFEMPAPDDRGSCSTPTMQQPPMMVHLRRMNDLDTMHACTA